MPGHYAHYRFAASQLRHMDPETRKTANRFRQLYDVGAQGPDILFYSNPFVKGKKHALGHQIHMEPGRMFFERAGSIYRMHPTEGAYAYLLGCLTHFCLDSMCHPYVNEVDASGAGKHIALETEFNRFLMDRDGKPAPHTTDPSGYLTLTRGECETAAAFYQGVNIQGFFRCMSLMRVCQRLLAVPDGFLRNLVAKAVGAIGHGGFLMTKGPDPQHCCFNEEMLELYGRAMKKYPGMLEQLRAHLQTGSPLGEEFDEIYG